MERVEIAGVLYRLVREQAKKSPRVLTGHASIRQARPGVTMAGGRFLISCTHCKRIVVIVTRIAEADAERLRMHLRACCPGKVIGLPPDVAATLRHFRIKATDPGAEPPPGTG